MKNLCALVSCFMIISFHSYETYASASTGTIPLVKVRAFDHGEFFRIVLEGSSELVGSGKVEPEGNGIRVSFSKTDFTIEKANLELPCKRDDGTVMCSLKHPFDLKVFTLDEPKRLVIDAYRKKETVKQDVRTDKDATAPNTGKSSVSYLEPTSADASAIHTKKAALQGKPEGGKETQGHEKEIKTNEDGIYLPDALEKISNVVKKENNPFKAISQLSSSKPSDAASLAAYHLLYAEALDAAKEYFGAIEQFRLAYIHATDAAIKETALFKRAEVYTKLRFFYEARVNYQVFISDFPSSKYIQKAYLGLANSLSETGSFEESVTYYEKAGQSPEVLFNMANALQKLEKFDEARRIYANAMAADRTFPERSPETFFYLAENLRMTGRTNDAKKIYRTIESGPYRDEALLGLGLIAMEEQNITEAIEYFQLIAFTRNLKVKVNALFYLSLAYLKKGKLRESIETLEDVRKKYIDSSMYDEALLVLAKLYRQEGRLKESIALLKELVYGKQPPKEAFNELEEILEEASGRNGDANEGEVRFTDLWREVGQWMLDPSRADFLMKIAEKLKPEGKPFIQVCSWLAENAQGKARVRAAVELADYYASMDDLQAAGKYANIAREAGKEMKLKETDDIIRKIDSRINYARQNSEKALDNIMAVSDFTSSDFMLLGSIINDLKRSGENIRKAVDHYEKMIEKNDGNAEDYVRLADILYDLNEEKALGYYRTAYEKDPDNEWAVYRIATIVDRPETNELFGKLEKGDSLISLVARTKIREIHLLNRLEEVYQ